MENLTEILGVIIVISPLLIFLIIMRILRSSLRSQNIKIADLLVETDQVPPPPPNTPNADANADNAAAPADQPVKRSASRFILFLSGITSLILATCMTTYYFYMKIYCISCEGGLDLSEFTNVLLALGIGVVPYSVNQIKKVKL